VLASNLGGGIRRHLGLVTSVTPVDVRELPDPLPLPAKIRAGRLVLRSTGAPLVVTHGVAAAVAARHRGRRLAGVRHVEHWHGDPFYFDSRRGAAYRALARVGRAPDLQVFTHEWLVPLYHDRRSPFEVLPNTVPEMSPMASPASNSSRTAVFMGRLSPEKGVVDLLAAWPRDSEVRGWSLDVHGSGPLESGRPPTGVTFRGEATDVMGVLAAADLVVIPSWTETGPYIACEAMSAGRPFIGTLTGDMREFLASGCGWAVPPRRPDLLGAALLAAQSLTREETGTMGERGRRWLAEHRPFAAWADAVERIYAL
jgi:glycosyltransferase involved in cell wall biosynthesis